MDEARARAAEASHALDESRLRLREEVEQVAADEGGADAALPGIPVPIKVRRNVCTGKCHRSWKSLPLGQACLSTLLSSHGAGYLRNARRRVHVIGWGCILTPGLLQALNDVLIRDVGGKLAASSKWPLVVDTSGQASVFLRYQVCGGPEAVFAMYSMKGVTSPFVHYRHRST